MSVRVHLHAFVGAAALGAAAAGVARADEVVRFVQQNVDIGPVTDAQPVLHPFSFTNISGRTIRLGMSYCHFCTPPILDRVVFKPGESGTLVLEIDPAGQRGLVRATATVFEEGKPGTATNIELKAEVCPRVWVEPSNMFPRITRGAGAAGKFTVLGRGRDFKVLRIEAEPPMDGFEIGAPETIEDCGGAVHRQEVTVRFPKDAPLGPFGARLRVITTDDQTAPKMVLVDGKVTGVLSFEPLVIGARLGAGAAFQQTFDIVPAEGGGPVMLQSLDVTRRDECAGLVLDARPVGASRVRVTLSGYAPLRSREHVDIEIEVVATTLTSADTETIRVPVTLIVRGPEQER